MNRVDSGFTDLTLQQYANKATTMPIHRSNTAPTRQRNQKKNPSDLVVPTQPTEMESQRAASERRTRPSRQKSTTSSSDNSAGRSKRRGPGSKPSSRRTSCTIVDPSRPARHYRVKSSSTIPNAHGQDIDDVLALHFRGCSLFSNPSYQTNPNLPSPRPSEEVHFARPGGPLHFNSMDISPVGSPNTHKLSEETIATANYPATTMHWTSPSTRQRDYERIDRANSGLRGMMRKVLPRSVSGPQEKFYEKDQSDAGSVRRYRLDSMADDIDHEKQAVSHAYSKTKSDRLTAAKSKKKWLCF